MTAEAIRFAVEELPSPRLLGVFMQFGDQRFDADSIRSLYEESDYLQKRMDAWDRPAAASLTRSGHVTLSGSAESPGVMRA